jgi:hypothetical protein
MKRVTGVADPHGGVKSRGVRGGVRVDGGHVVGVDAPLADATDPRQRTPQDVAVQVGM